MERQYVESSMLTSIGYDKVNSILELEFKSNGQVWQYADFPETEWYEFEISPSKGKFFHARILGQYPENRVG